MLERPIEDSKREGHSLKEGNGKPIKSQGFGAVWNE